MKMITRSGHKVVDVQKSFYGGWVGWINGICIHWCYDFTYSEIEIWNPVEKKDLIKGELDIVSLPVGFDFVPRFHSKSDMIEVLQKRGLFHHSCFNCDKDFFTDNDLMQFECPDCVLKKETVLNYTQLKLFL